VRWVWFSRPTTRTAAAMHVEDPLEAAVNVTHISDVERR
jgi:hypothetical protein